MLHDINLLNWRRRQQLLTYRRWLGCVASGVVISMLFQGLLLRSVRNQQHLLSEEQMKRQQQILILKGRNSTGLPSKHNQIRSSSG
ncbi:hypothetical protein P4S72_09650 [Vibrio sp. PP-XX7]